MTYTFQSRVTADLIMLKVTAEQVLKLLGKPLHEPGIVTVENIPEAVAILEKAALEDDARRKTIKDEMEGRRLDDAATQEQIATTSELLGPISLRQRVVPLIDMLRSSAEENKPVTWTVA